MCLRGTARSDRPSDVTRVQLTDAEREFIEPYLPIGEYGPYPERLRQQFEGVIWRFKTGGQWREMPTEFGAWSTVHNRFRHWRDAGCEVAVLEVRDLQSIAVMERYLVRGDAVSVLWVLIRWLVGVGVLGGGSGRPGPGPGRNGR